MKSAFLPIGVLALAFVGCSKNIDTTEAVKQGIINDISKKVDVRNMDVNVDSVSFQDKQARANVSFRPKDGNASQSITMTYNLVREGDEWRVRSRDMMRHEQSQPPSGSETGNQSGAAGSQQLPPGHPAITGGQGQPLPPGHPATSGSSSSPVIHQ